MLSGAPSDKEHSAGSRGADARCRRLESVTRCDGASGTRPWEESCRQAPRRMVSRSETGAFNPLPTAASFSSGASAFGWKPRTWRQQLSHLLRSEARVGILEKQYAGGADRPAHAHSRPERNEGWSRGERRSRAGERRKTGRQHKRSEAAATWRRCGEERTAEESSRRPAERPPNYGERSGGAMPAGALLSKSATAALGHQSAGSVPQRICSCARVAPDFTDRIARAMPSQLSLSLNNSSNCSPASVFSAFISSRAAE